jgi:hypothetical protein
MSCFASRVRAGASGVLLLIGVATPAVAAEYTYANIADDSGTFASFGTPRINNLGAVSFSAHHDDIANGVYRSDGTTITTIADSTGPVQIFGNDTDINDAGQVAYTGTSVFAVDGVFRGSGGAVTTIADTSGSLGNIDPTIRINNAGLVAFVAAGEGSTAAGFVLAGSGGTLSAIGGSDFTLQTSSIYGAEINDAGTVSFGKSHVVLGPGFPPSVIGMSQSIATSNGATGAVVTDLAGPYESFGTRAPINDAGHVIFIAAPDGSGGTNSQIALFDGAGFQTLVDTADGQFTTLAQTELAAADRFAFFGTVPGDLDGIFTGPDAVADRVAIEGQSLFGSTLTDAQFALGGMNDIGQIVFRYSLADGRTGIAVATPVPEPVSAIGLASASLGLMLRRRRRV